MGNQPFLALITPLGSAGIGGGEQPPYPSQGPGFPTHPIAEPPWGWGKPPGYNPRPDQGLPGNQPYPDQGLPGPQPHPEHPIVIPPLGIWGPTDPRPTPPIYIPIMPPPTEENPHPEHPIYLPVYPSHPIYFPPGTSPAEIAQKLKELVEFATGNLPTNPDETPTPVK